MEKFSRKALFPCRKIPHGNSPFHRCNGPLVEIRRPIWYTEPEKGERSMTFGEKVQALRRHKTSGGKRSFALAAALCCFGQLVSQ